MFDLKKPCKDCPFRLGMGENFGLHPERLQEIFSADAFQCHKTVDYSQEDREGRAGERPQQCAGLMSTLFKDNAPNTIMQVAVRLGHLNPDDIDGSDTYSSREEILKAHSGI